MSAITTGKARASFVHLSQPQAPQGGGDPKYSLTLLIPKSDVTTLNAIYAEMEAAKQAGVASKWNNVMPPMVATPLYDGDGVRPNGEPFGEECKGCMVITASAKATQKPKVVDMNVQEILDPTAVYSGCYVRANINFFAYNTAGKRGIGCGLNCVQKVGDGEPLGFSVNVNDAFGGANAYASPAPQPQYQQPAYGYAAPQQPQYQQPPYQQPVQPAIDPITGLPMTGGIMGM